MDPTALIPLVVGFVLLALLVRLIAGSMDGSRVEEYCRQRGYELVDKSWDPFGPGWFGEKESRIYQIIYRDKGGSLHRAHVKTSMFSGVYLTNDEVVEAETPADSADEAADSSALEEENAQLRAQIRELESRQG